MASTTTIHVPQDMPAAELFQRAQILDRPDDIPSHLQLFIDQADLVLRRVSSLVSQHRLPPQRGAEFQQLLIDACARVLCHPIVASNRYLERFAQGITEAQAQHECQQFSIFALNFDVAQAKLVANAPTTEAYRERLNVLLNEKGIPYREGFEGDLTGNWSAETVHFTWMLKMAVGLGLEFEEVGKIWLALPGTKAFVEATLENYGSADQNVASGAAFAIENWAANGLWKPWIAGMEQLNARRLRQVDLGYLKYHNLEEEHHSQATLDELLENFIQPWFRSEMFLDAAERMLTDGVQAYYQSQLDTLPERDDTWPQEACDPPLLDAERLPRIAPTSVVV